MLDGHVEWRKFKVFHLRTTAPLFLVMSKGLRGQRFSFNRQQRIELLECQGALPCKNAVLSIEAQVDRLNFTMRRLFRAKTAGSGIP